MDAGRVGSLYIRAVESLLRGNAMRLTLTFKDSIDRRRLASSFKTLVKSHRSLRLAFKPGGWSLLDDSQVEAELSAQTTHLASLSDPDEVYDSYFATNTSLPIRLDLVEDRRAVFSLNHVYGNGRTALHYIEDLLCHYAGEPANSGAQTGAPAQTSLASRLVQMAAGTCWTAAYLAGFVMKAGSRSGAATVDLTRGRVPPAVEQGYAVWTYILSKSETAAALARSEQAGLTVTENLCRVMARALFEEQPEKTRVCISVPTDVGAFVSGFSRHTPGNYTGSLIVQCREGARLDADIRRSFQWARRGVHHWTPWLLGRVSGEAGLAARFERQARLAAPDRAPFENFSCAVSSVGVVQGTMTRRYLTSISAHTRTQTILVCCITINGCMSIEVSASRSLFDCNEVVRITDRAVAMFSGSAEIAAKRSEFKEERV